mmetsp:Transcript_9754/g.21980  ORF Transcript_9754/g.21980 Transcript_9754/m.21980 type:complete len:474 (+) Transcript_9754:86-1507(+)|eukprot:CAMPEP_0172300092 /NCGR_PEP_ID=MMETSP1058-20130122/2268_1 /TAXON_ID=83371 /ORGANISM="Detonula confervacea, Strain CCMP 353" /LENGTH=473 /DNA_ID=CAMNT_0013009783 /DNA_START=55 /DNA_END=1476 /DNA_ORIENTATION=-
MARKKSKVVATKPKVQEEEVASTSSSEAEEEVVDGESSDESASASDAEQMSVDSSNENDDDEESAEDDDMDDDERPTNNDTSNNTSNGDEQCTFDLTNLLAFNTHQVNAAELYQPKGRPNSEWYNESLLPTITAVNSNQLPNVNEAFLLAKAAEGTTQLLQELWKLPTEKTDVGPKAKLPNSTAETTLPRSLPAPPPKKLSKWEEFALKRGIAPSAKNSRKVFDESTGEWKHLTGSLQSKANAGPESWPILEVKKNDDPMADPWEKLREEKKTRVNKNVESRMRNAEKQGTLERGSANKLVKNNARLEKQRDIAREKEQKRGLVAPVGVPSDMKRDAQRGKPSTALALKATQMSTASLGRFDKQREGEPEKQFAKTIAGKKRKQLDTSGGASGTNKKFLQTEAQKSVDILQRVMNGGSSSKEKERDVKKGKYARGETAYDHEFDDGLGPGSFKKKKGRAGMGKMKKITKKRIK